MLLYEQKSCITFQTNGVSIGTLECLAVPKFTTSLDTGPQSFLPLIALSMIRYLKSCPKSAVQMCQVVSVVMETTQLVLSQFKNFLSQSIENWIRSFSTKILVNVKNWWSYVILIVAVWFFETQCRFGKKSSVYSRASQMDRQTDRQTVRQTDRRTIDVIAKRPT